MNKNNFRLQQKSFSKRKSSSKPNKVQDKSLFEIQEYFKENFNQLRLIRSHRNC